MIWNRRKSRFYILGGFLLVFQYVQDTVKLSVEQIKQI